MSIVFEGENFSVKVISRNVRSKPQQFEVVVRPRVALCIPTLGEHLVLVKQFRVAMNHTVLEFPAGKVEAGESSEQAARREMLEEIGYRADELNKLGTLLSSPEFSDEVIDVFGARGEISTQPSPAPKEEFREVVKMTPAEVAKSILDGRLNDSKSIAAYTVARSIGKLFEVGL